MDKDDEQYPEDVLEASVDTDEPAEGSLESFTDGVSNILRWIGIIGLAWILGRYVLPWVASGASSFNQLTR